MNKILLFNKNRMQQITDPALPPDRAGLGIDLNQPSNRYVFHNEGADWIDFGRPAWLEDMVAGVDSFTIRLRAKVASESNTGYAIALRDGSTSPTQFALLQSSTSWAGYVGSPTGVTVANVDENNFQELILTASPTQFAVFSDGVKSSVGTTGTETTTGNLYLGGRTNGSSANFEGDSCCVEFYKGECLEDGSLSGLELLESFDLNQESGSTVTGVNGTVGTVTDGTPVGVWKYYGSNVYLGRNVFRNNGTDSISIPNASALVQALDPDKSWTIAQRLKVSDMVSNQYILGLVVSLAPENQQLAIIVLPSTDRVVVRVGGAQDQATYTYTGDFLDVLLTSDGSDSTIYMDGVEILSFTNGSFTTTNDLHICGFSEIAENVEGDFTTWSAYSDHSTDGTTNGLTLLDSFSLNQSEGATVTGVNGTVGTVIDGSPTGVWQLAWTQ